MEVRPVSKELVESDDEVLLLLRYVAPLDIGTQVVEPPEAAALPTSIETCIPF